MHGATPATDRFGDSDSSYQFTAGNHIDIGKPLPAAFGAFSTSLWVGDMVDPGSEGKTHADLIGNRETSNEGSWWLGVYSDGSVGFNAVSGTGNEVRGPPGSIQFGQTGWSQLTLSREDNGSTVIYLNGQVIAQGVNSSSSRINHGEHLDW